MSDLTGTLRRIGGAWFVDHSYNLSDEPVRVTIRWRVVGMQAAPGNYGPAPEAVDGVEVTHVRDSDRFELYRHGARLLIDTEHEGAILRELVPAPRVRSGTETRYRLGGWEKYTKRGGWVPHV